MPEFSCWLAELKWTSPSVVWLDDNGQQTKEALKAKRFDSKKECDDWLLENNLTFKYHATDHVFLDVPGWTPAVVKDDQNA